MTLAPRWLRARAGVRIASALSAAAVVALALVVAGVALILLVGESLSKSVEADATQSAQAIATRMHGNYGKRVNGSYTAKENAVEALDTLMGRGDPALAQILVDYSDDQDGSGWALQDGSDNASLGPMSDITPNSRQTTVVSSAFVPDKGGTMHAVLVAVGGTTTTSDPMHFVVLYAAPLSAVDAAQNTVMFFLMIGVPILIVVAGAATYVFAGRALRPVEAIRARVASMSEKDLAERVPVPAARDEVGRLAETMNEMIARLEHGQQVQRRFVADASHELRSPLATIGAGLELLQNSDPGTVGALRGETRRLGRLVDDLLLLARADERGLQPRRDEVDLDEIAEAERARPYDDGVRTEVRAEHVRVIGDRGQLMRVLRNLVDNAHRHGRSRVLVTLGREDDRAALDVADDGPGVPVADRDRIFERFVRLDDARARADGGSGLGLAIVAEVVAAHEGRVWVEEAPGGGALFRVRLPAAALPVDEDAEPAELQGAPVAVAPAPTTNGHAAENGARRPNGTPSPAPRPNGTPAFPRSGAPTSVRGYDGAAQSTATPAGAAPAGAGPNGIAPNAGVPNAGVPNAGVPNAGVPNAGVPNGVASTRGAHSGATPKGAAPGGVAPNEAALNRAPQNWAAPDAATPNGATAEGAARTGATPHGLAPNGTAPNDAGSDGVTRNAVPSGAPPNGIRPNEAAPTGATHNGATHNRAAPSGAGSNGAGSNGAAPNGSAPNATAPNGATPSEDVHNGATSAGTTAMGAAGDRAAQSGATPTGAAPAGPNGALPAAAGASGRPSPTLPLNAGASQASNVGAQEETAASTPLIRSRRARRRPILRRAPLPAPVTDDPYADWVPPQPPTPTSGRA